jgi:hypothetical protein
LGCCYLFPYGRLSTDPRSGITRRHLDHSGLQRAVKAAWRKTALLRGQRISMESDWIISPI